MPVTTTRQPAADRIPNEDIAALVRCAASGDCDRWAELVAEFAGMMRAITRAHRLNEADAADVLQTCWLRLLEHIDGLHDPSRVAGWLATTVRRECLRILRHTGRQIPAGDELPSQLAADPPLDQRLLIAERDAALRRALEQLRASDQTLLGLLTSECPPSYEVISDTLDMPIGSIGPTRARALQRLRRELERQDALELVAA